MKTMVESARTGTANNYTIPKIEKLKYDKMTEQRKWLKRVMIERYQKKEK